MQVLQKYCGNGLAHGPPNNTLHLKCNYNKKWKVGRLEWVCKKIGVDFKEYEYCSGLQCRDCDKTERDKGTWVKVRKRNI